MLAAKMTPRWSSPEEYLQQEETATDRMKILVKANGLYTYPDAMLVCGQIEFVAERKDIINPLVIVEVLSDSTQSYDRGDKFALYRGIPVFAHYVLIHQDQPHIEYHQKTNRGWLLTELVGLDTLLTLPGLDFQLPLTELYLGVDWFPATASIVPVV